jgi:3-oxoacyl-[acyl-carrier-protein] synthase III
MSLAECSPHQSSVNLSFCDSATASIIRLSEKCLDLLVIHINHSRKFGQFGLIANSNRNNFRNLWNKKNDKDLIKMNSRIHPIL